LGCTPYHLMELITRSGSISCCMDRVRRILTGTVTRFKETLLIAVFIAYKTLNMTNAILSDAESLFWTNKPWANKLHLPIVPHSTCRAVTVYRYGKCTNTTFLYNVRERLKKYKASQNS